MSTIKKINNVYVVTDISLKMVDEMLLNEGQELKIDIKVIDNRKISSAQRKFIFSLCNEISYHTGDDKEWTRLLVQQYNANLRGIDVLSLSDCSVDYATGLIETIITFCIEKEYPFSKKLIDEHKYKFTSQQTYAMCLKRVCAICGARADIHHVDHIGMGYNRHKISHIGKRALPLCRKHHTKVHTTGEEKFIEMYHLTPIVIDKKMEYFIKKGIIRYFESESEK
jgi:hypothetical protein